MTKFKRLIEAEADYNKNGKSVGVFLKGPGRGSQERKDTPAYPNHVGLLFVDDLGKTREFHFVTDNKIISEELRPTKPYFHAELGLDPMNASGFAAYLSVFLKEGKMPQIKYGLDWLSVLGAFAQDGTYKFTDAEGDPGMTCSLFVNELLAARGHHLVDYSKWPKDRVTDLEWRRRKLDALRDKPGFTPERIAAMEKLDPFVRLLPEEVAAVEAEDEESWGDLEFSREPLVGGQEVRTDQAKTITELAQDIVRAFEEAFD